jgi:hypothetical protein
VAGLATWHIVTASGTQIDLYGTDHQNNRVDDAVRSILGKYPPEPND